MGRPESVTPTLSEEEDEESGEVFTDGDFDDLIGSDGECSDPCDASSKLPLLSPVPASASGKHTEDIHLDVTDNDGVTQILEHFKGSDENLMMNGFKNGFASDSESHNGSEPHLSRRGSILEQTPSIVGILGDQQNHAEQRLAARRAARAEAREIRMRELERQQRDQETHADRAYDMHTETVGVARRLVGGVSRLNALSPTAGLSPLSPLSPRRSSDDSDDTCSAKDLRSELKALSERFRAAMVVTAQLDNDKAALAYRADLLAERLQERAEEHAQLMREHKEKCSSLERLRREHAAVERELESARDAVRARDAAAHANGFAFVEAAGCTEADGLGMSGEGFGSVPPLALVSRQAEEMLNSAGEGTLDVRLQRLLTSRQELESEVRRLKLALCEERGGAGDGAGGRGGGGSGASAGAEAEAEAWRKACAEAKARAVRAEGEAALQAQAVARLEAQVARLRTQQESQESSEEQLKHERRRLQREAREALNRVEELETENSHLTKRLDKLKNAKSALLKDL